VYANNQIIVSKIDEPVAVTLFSITANVLLSRVISSDITLPINYKGVVFVKLESASGKSIFKLAAY
jgi:hypothetical protein